MSARPKWCNEIPVTPVSNSLELTTAILEEHDHNDHQKTSSMKDPGHERNLSNARVKNHRAKQKESKVTTLAGVSKSKDRVEHRRVKKLYVVERSIDHLRNNETKKVVEGLKGLLLGIDDRCDCADDNRGALRWNVVNYYHTSLRAVKYDACEALMVCLQKQMCCRSRYRRENIIMFGLKALRSLLDGNSWSEALHDEDDGISEKEETNYFILVRTKCYDINMVNNLLMFLGPVRH